MSRIVNFKTACILFGLMLSVLVLPVGSYAFDLSVRVTDTTVAKNAASGWLTVFVTNPVDSIGGLSLWLQLDRPDLVRFDSVVDTAGTALSGFELVIVRSPSSQWTDIKITALADNLPNGQPPKRGFGPSMAERALLRVRFHLLSIPDTTQSRTAAVGINSGAAWFNFARPNGTTIGLAYQFQPDTSFYRCLQPQGPDCLQWQVVSGPPYDSFSVQIDTIPYLDTISKVHLTRGSVTVSNSCLRTWTDTDIDMNGFAPTVTDYVALLRFILSNDSIGPLDRYAADVNGDCIIDMGDAIKLDSIFKYGPMICDFVPCYLPCRCDHIPVRKCCWLSRGNFNGDITDLVDLADLSALVTYLTGGQINIGCPEEANIDGAGVINLADLSRLVGFLTGTGTLPAACP
jgi:hypothetical protein